MDNLESYIKLDNDIRQRPIVFQGTHAEWETLTSTQKAHYQYIAFTDDTGSPEVVDQVPTQNSTHLVQSGGVWTKANRIDQNFGTVELSSVAAYAHAVGETFINAAGQMVKCTAAIAIGDTIAIGSNVAITSVASALSEINSNISILEYTKAGTRVDLSSSQTFLVPSNGYVSVASGNLMGDYSSCAIYGSNEVFLASCTARTSVTNSPSAVSNYVKKGMFVTGITVQGDGKVSYVPLV